MKNLENLPPILRDFAIYMNVVLGRSENTVKEYILDLTMFFRFIKHYKNLVSKNVEFENIIIKDVDLDFIKTISLTELYEFLNYLANARSHTIHYKVHKGNSARSRARRVSCIKTFYKYLTNKVKLIEYNPAAELETPKLKKTLPVHLSVDESIRLLESVDGKTKQRDYAIFTLFLNCGMRLSELVSINISDIKENTVVITGKGNKERTVYLNLACLSAIEDYLKVRPKEKVKPEYKNALFLSSQNKRISVKTVQWIVKTHLDKAGLDTTKLSTHKLRHTAATLMYQHGNVDLRSLQEILGHEQLSTTEIYTHISKESLLKAVESNPLAQIKKKKE